MLSRVRDGLEGVFTERSAPDDEVEFDASLDFVQAHAEDGSCASQAVVNVWVALQCPEIGNAAKSTVQVMVPVQLLETAEEVAEVGNNLWDSLQSHRSLCLLEQEMGDSG